MRRNNRPWPAFVDLFSALFIASFAGLVLLTGKTAIEIEKQELRATVDTLATQLQKYLTDDQALESRVERVGDDVVIDLYIHFDRNSDRISIREELSTLERLIGKIKATLDDVDARQRSNVEVIIEGHSDSQQASGEPDPRTRYLYNWDLSSRRAISVLYEFKRLGLAPPDYSVIAIGYADSVPKCVEKTEACYRENRRTTIRLRPDMARIERAQEAGI